MRKVIDFGQKKKGGVRVLLAAELAPGVYRMPLGESQAVVSWIMDRAVRFGDSTVLCNRYPDRLVAAFIPLKKFRQLEKAADACVGEGGEPLKVSRIDGRLFGNRYHDTVRRVKDGGECMVIHCLKRPIVALVSYPRFLLAEKVFGEGLFLDDPGNWDETTLLDPEERREYMRRLALEKERERKLLKKEAIVSGKAKVAYGNVVRQVQSGEPVVVYGYRGERKIAAFVSLKKIALLRKLHVAQGLGELRTFDVSATYVRFHYAALMDRVVKDGECAIASRFGRPTIALVPYEIYRLSEDVPSGKTAPENKPEERHLPACVQSPGAGMCSHGATAP